MGVNLSDFYAPGNGAPSGATMGMGIPAAVSGGVQSSSVVPTTGVPPSSMATIAWGVGLIAVGLIFLHLYKGLD